MTAVALKRVVRIVPGQSPPSEDVSDFEGSGLPFLQGNAEFGRSYPAAKHRCDSAPKRAEAGDILLSVRAPVGALNIAERQYGIGRGLAALRPMAIEPRFAWWSLHAAVDQLRASAAGSTFEAITADDIGRLVIQLPSPSTQQKIAAYLDAETARIDSLIEKKRSMMSLLEDRLAVARVNAVVGADVATASQAIDLLWLGSLPEHWRIEKLKYAARMESGHTPSKQVPEYWENCTIPWVTLNDVGHLEDDDEFANPKNRINELGLANSSARVLPARTVILSRDATVGRAAMLGVPMAISQHFVGWICGPTLLPEYLLEVLRGPLQGLFKSLSFGSTIPTIGVPELRDLVVPIPPLDEQHTIVDDLQLTRTAIQRTTALITSQIDRLAERRATVITAAVTGQLDLAKAAA